MDVACRRECLTPTVRLGWQKNRESHKALSNVELTIPRDRRKRSKTSQRREKKINGKYWVTEKLLRNDASYQNKQTTKQLCNYCPFVDIGGKLFMHRTKKEGKKQASTGNGRAIR